MAIFDKVKGSPLDWVPVFLDTLTWENCGFPRKMVQIMIILTMQLTRQYIHIYIDYEINHVDF